MGSLNFRDSHPVAWVVDAYKGGLISAQSTVEVSDDSIQELNFRLVRDQAQTAMEEADASIVVEAQRETSEVSVKTLSADQIQYLPGSNGDVVKAIQNLPASLVCSERYWAVDHSWYGSRRFDVLMWMVHRLLKSFTLAD